MSTEPTFQLLELANERPDPFAVYTALELWADPHTSSKMLDFHLNENLSVASRPQAFIEQSTQWMTEHFSITEDTRIADFGCGPGLYASRLAQRGANVVGIDFSPRSVAHARQFAVKNSLDVTYIEANYLDVELEGAFDLVIMVMCDFCALSPNQRTALLSKFQSCLAPGGRVLLDVYSLAAFETKSEENFYEKNQLDGFWSEAPYYAFVRSFKYEPERVSLDKYTIIESTRHRVVYNWLQYFSAESLADEVENAGFSIEALVGDVAGSPFDPADVEFAAVLRQTI
ncbi:MAG: class I SAM-dependent methyltransferase [Pseudomonadota bacterium]